MQYGLKSEKFSDKMMKQYLKEYSEWYQYLNKPNKNDKLFESEFEKSFKE
jgi:hypothetical protein